MGVARLCDMAVLAPLAWNQPLQLGDVLGFQLGQGADFQHFDLRNMLMSSK